MNKNDILQEAGRRLGDTSPDFVSQILKPSLDFVLLDLAQYEAMASLRRSRTFTIIAGREFDTREITGLMPHAPLAIEQILVFPWGPVEGAIRKVTEEEIDNLRLQQGESATGKWRQWSISKNPYLLKVQPPAGPDEVGTEAEVLFVAPPATLADDDDMIEIQREHLETLVYGINARACVFKGETENDAQVQWQLYMQGRSRMWGQRWNARIRHIHPFPF